VNSVIRTFSEFCQAAFKPKDPSNPNYEKIQKLGKKLGVKINIKQMQEEGIKNRDYIYPIKEKCLMKLWDTINESNDLIIKNEQNKGYSKLYKYGIGKGNNSHLVRNLMNQRWWWQSHPRENISELNFLWTQWKVETQLEKLPSKIPKPKDIPEDSDIEKEDQEPSATKTDQENESSPNKEETKVHVYLP
jgi:hypothetical protein